MALSAAERDWIRRQGRIARVVADEQRRVRQRPPADDRDVTRALERLRHDRRFDRRRV
jgi:hypothetical protein